MCKLLIYLVKRMKKNKKVFVSFERNNELACFDIDTIISFQEQSNLRLGNIEYRNWLRVTTTKGSYQLYGVKAQELIDQMTNIEIRGAYAKKQRD